MRSYLLPLLRFFTSFLLAACLLVVSFLSVHELQAQNEQSKRKPQQKTDKEQLITEGLFTEGMKHFLLSDYKEALRKFKDAWQMQPNNAAINYQIAYTYHKLLQPAKALDYARKAVQISDKDPYYYKLVADIYISRGELPQAIDTYKRLLQKNEQATPYQYNLAGLYLQLGKLDDAIKAYEKLEAVVGPDEKVIRQKQRIYLKLEKKEEAIAEGEKLMNAFPEEPLYGLELARLLVSYNMKQEAKRVLEVVANNGAEPAQIALIEASMHEQADDQQAYIASLEQAFRSRDIPFQQKAQQLKKLSADPVTRSDGKRLAGIVAEVHPSEPAAHLLYADFLSATAQYKQAYYHYREALALSPDNFAVWERSVQLALQNEQYEQAADDAEEALELFPNQAKLLVLQATANFMLQNYADAEESLELAQMFVQDESLRLQVLAQMADVKHNLKQFAASDALFEQVLAEEPAHKYVLNNYSQFLAERGEKLGKADELSKQLLSLDKGNPNYLDTRALVLFRLNRFEEAKSMLQEVLASYETPSIIEHYGDVLFKLGEVEKAVEQWQKAQNLNQKENELLNKKIAEQRWIDGSSLN